MQIGEDDELRHGSARRDAFSFHAPAPVSGRQAATLGAWGRQRALARGALAAGP
ncbi:hypothetical protein SF83666_c01060 [Sinorhizobium fredii CCBAU 83666]|nr:hypothetical protein SF83666_c01060 [Sinorhizobium fredii CCBAU 83666]